MPMVSREQREQILYDLKETGGKYSKPFDKGKVAKLSIFGGDWDQYAQIILQMLTVDTLLEISEQLDRLNIQYRAGTRRRASLRMEPRGRSDH